MEIILVKGCLLAALFFISVIAGVVPIKLFNRLHSNAPASLSKSLAVSLLTCFAGGVFLGVCLLDMLPQALELMEELRTISGYTGTYPWVMLLTGFGFFFVYILDEVTGWCCGHSHSFEEDLETSKISIPRVASGLSLASSTTKIPFSKDDNAMNSSEMLTPSHTAVSSMSRSATFLLAFVCHCSLEGFAFGVQKDALSVISLFCGIIAHKAIVFFSIGVRLVRSHPSAPVLISSWICAVAVTAPLGGAIGILVEDSVMEPVTKNIVLLTLTCLSLGTFLYITFFEMLPPEQTSDHSRVLQWTASFGGFILIAIMMIFGD